MGFGEEINNKCTETKNLSLNYKNDTLEISLWSKNIANTKYAIRGYTFILDPTYQVKSYQSFGDPRTVGVTLNFNL